MRCVRLAKGQPPEITMVQISEVQESPAFNRRRSFLTLRHCVGNYCDAILSGESKTPELISVKPQVTLVVFLRERHGTQHLNLETWGYQQHG
jgi:hypothetical protein